MDEGVAVVVMFALFAAIILAVLFVGWGSLDETVVQACEKQGYWQTGQTRVICNVEKK